MSRPRQEKICGIYCYEVISGNPDKIGWKYTGQSVHVLKRKTRHNRDLRNYRHCSPKLQAYYNKYGPNSIKFTVLQKCSEKELNFWETFWITCFDGVDNGFNCDYGGNCSSKEYLNKQCLFKNIMTGEEIMAESLIWFSEKYHIPPSMLSALSLGKINFAHGWYCPANDWKPIYYHAINTIDNKKYIIPYNGITKFCKLHNIKSISGFAKMLTEDSEFYKHWKRSDSKILERKGKFVSLIRKYKCKKFKLISPEGKLVTGENLVNFCKENGLKYSSLRSLLQGKIKQHKRWKTYVDGIEIKQIEPICRLISPDGQIFDVFNMTKFARERGLKSGGIIDIKIGKSKSYKGWRIYNENAKIEPFIFKNNTFYIQNTINKEIYKIENARRDYKNIGISRKALSELKNKKALKYKDFILYEEKQGV